MTKQCKDYNYVPPWFASMTDGFGGKWAIQTSQNETATNEEWAENLNSVVFPDDFSPWENITLTTNQTHASYLVGDSCFSFVFKDNNENTWHLYHYPEDISKGLFASINCIPFTLQKGEAVPDSTSSAWMPTSLWMMITIVLLQCFSTH